MQCAWRGCFGDSRSSRVNHTSGVIEQSRLMHVWSDQTEPIEEVPARFARVECGKLLQVKLLQRDSTCVCTWMVEARSSRARQETAPFCLQVHVQDEAPHYEIDEGQPLARLSTSALKRGVYFRLSPFVCVCICDVRGFDHRSGSLYCPYLVVLIIVI